MVFQPILAVITLPVLERKFKSGGMCDSFLGEGEEGVAALLCRTTNG
jgi:hypothetical protein